jgi:hypothetical protein
MEAHHERFGRCATELQLCGLDQLISRWLLDFSIDFKSTYINIIGARGPKEGLIEKQYFDMLRKKHGASLENTPSGGIIYSEMLPEQMDIHYSTLVNELARDLISQDIGASVLKSRQAMYRDVLSSFAKPILDKLADSRKMITSC